MRNSRTRRSSGVLGGAVALAALGTAVSPLTAGVAHAAPTAEECRWSIPGQAYTDCLSIEPNFDGLPVNVGLRDDYLITDSRGTASDRKWSFKPKGDGSFLIAHNDTGKCVNVDSGNKYLAVAACNVNNPKQSFYLQPTDPTLPIETSGSYVIRSVQDDRCMDVQGGSSKPGAWVILYGCGSGKSNQQFFVTGIQGNLAGPKRGELATAYALKQCADNSRVIRSCNYKVAGDSRASVGEPRRITDYVWNYSQYAATRSVSWSQTTSQTQTVGGSVTVSAEFGFNIKAVQTKITAAVSAHYSQSWTSSETVTDTDQITVDPGDYSWVMRGQLMKTVTGNWTFTNDLGMTWSGNGTATIPAVNGTDGLASARVLCTSSNPAQVCVDSRVGGKASARSL